MKLRHLTTSALALILMAACTDATGVEPDDLAGEWTSTSILLTSLGDNPQSVNLTAQDAAEITLMLEADGSYTFTFVSDVEETENEAGEYTVVDGTLTTDPTGEKGPETWTISRDGNTMTLTGSDDYAFTQEVFVDVTMLITLTR